MMPIDRRAGAGSIEDGVHVFPVRVYYEDTDAIGMVYHSNYLQFAERARTELLRHFGFRQSQLWTEQRIGFVIRRCIVDFLAPARLDDLLLVTSRLIEMRGASLHLQQNVARDGLDLVRIQVKVACVSVDGRPARLPLTLRGALAKFSGDDWSEYGKQRG
jgi:acyl-CoA thioester hydrolase